ncbi:MAG TPA: multicopper oxidase domain-containing protein [Candidatus Kapabacteria bacterium]
MNRRNFLKSLGALSVVGASGTLLAACSTETPPVETPKRGSQLLGIPATNYGSGEFIAAMGSVDIWKGIPSNVIAVNGALLGPTIRIKKGNTLNINFTNGLTELSNIHWHGLNVPADMDGHPKDAVPAGSSKRYTFPVVDRAGTYWYHAHPDMRTGYQAYMGLAGALIVSDDEEDALNLPDREFDIPLILQDKRLDADNKILWDRTPDDIPSGYLGDVMFVNGTPDAFHEVTRGLYRLRFINASNARIYMLGFEDKRTMHLIANDGGLLDKPYPMTEIKLSPGERVEVLVDFKNDLLGSSIKLKTLQYAFNSSHQNPSFPQGAEHDLVRFDVKLTTTNTYTVPSALTSYEKLDPTKAVNTRYFQFTMDHSREYGQHLINSLVFDMDRIDYSVKAGDLEIWEMENQGDAIHSMHIHGVQFQIIDRSFDALKPNDYGWKDTLLINGSEYVRVAVRFNDNKGIYMFHCHNLEHEDDGMMVNVEVV